MNMLSRIIGCLLGLAVGDAVGTTLEFRKKGSFTPITDMVGGGPFRLEPGQWTDDTSMALCLAHSLIHCRGFDAADQMRRYCNWYHHGYMSSTGACFDIGMTVSRALDRFLESGDPFSGSSDPRSAGNGSLMRLAPIPCFYAKDRSTAIHYAGESSRTTHGAAECIDACRFFADVILSAFSRNGPTDAAEAKDALFADLVYVPETEAIQRIARREFRDASHESLTGGGYVVESLESALWCFLHGSDFEEAILLAANIGNDADTTAAICGQIAGAFYGADGIPEKWRTRLAMGREIADLAVRLYETGASGGSDGR